MVRRDAKRKEKESFDEGKVTEDVDGSMRSFGNHEYSVKAV